MTDDSAKPSKLDRKIAEGVARAAQVDRIRATFPRSTPADAAVLGPPRNAPKSAVRAPDIKVDPAREAELAALVEIPDGVKVCLFELGYGRDKDETWTRADVLMEFKPDLLDAGYEPESIEAADSVDLIITTWNEKQLVGIEDDGAYRIQRVELDEQVRRETKLRRRTERSLVQVARESGRDAGRAQILNRRFGLLGDLSVEPQAGRPLNVLALDVVAEIRAKANEPVVRTPWPHFDEVTGGLELGSIMTVIGFQGSGKSSFAAQLGAHHAESGWTIYYLGEMTSRILVARIIGQRTGRPWQHVLRGKLTDAEMRAVLDPLKMLIVPRHPDPIAAIRQTLYDLRSAGVTGPIMLVVDYAQLLAVVSADMRVSNTEAVRQLQELVEGEDLVGVVLSQTSRANSKRIREGTEDSIDLADTGAETAELERCATLQLVLSYQQKDDTKKHEVTMAVTKRRFGGPTKLYFDFDGEAGVFTERSTPVKSVGEQAREDAILEALRVHEEGTCNGAANTQCVCRMNQNTLHKGFGGPKLHKVGGNKTALGLTLKRLENEKKIAKVGPEYRLVSGCEVKS